MGDKEVQEFHSSKVALQGLTDLVPKFLSLSLEVSSLYSVYLGRSFAVAPFQVASLARKANDGASKQKAGGNERAGKAENAELKQLGC